VGYNLLILFSAQLVNCPQIYKTLFSNLDEDFISLSFGTKHRKTNKVGTQMTIFYTIRPNINWSGIVIVKYSYNQW